MKTLLTLLIFLFLASLASDALAKGVIYQDGRGSTYYLRNRARPARPNPKPAAPANSVPTRPETLVAQPPVESAPVTVQFEDGRPRDIGLSNQLTNQIPILVPRVAVVQNTNRPPATVRKPPTTTEKPIMEVRYNDSDSILEFQKQNASKGDSRSQYALGLRYLEGIGVERNEILAREYLQKSSAQGDPRAKEKLKQLESGTALD